MNVGVILARFQPIHEGHIELIRKALIANEQVLILIGSANQFGPRNPIPIDVRHQLVANTLSDEFSPEEQAQITLAKLDDYSDESDNSHDWGFYLYTNIVKYISQDYFTIYYSDGFEIINTWFPGYILSNHISLSLLARGSVKSGISATLVRKYIEENNESLKEVVPAAVYEMKEIIKSFINIATKTK